MIFPEKIDFLGISSPAKTPSNVWTNWCVWVSKRLSTEVSSGVQQFVSMELSRSLIDGGNTAICLAANAIVTPSAWDLFKQKGIEVIRK